MTPKDQRKDDNETILAVSQLSTVHDTKTEIVEIDMGPGWEKTSHEQQPYPYPHGRPYPAATGGIAPGASLLYSPTYGTGYTYAYTQPTAGYAAPNNFTTPPPNVHYYSARPQAHNSQSPRYHSQHLDARTFNTGSPRAGMDPSTFRPLDSMYSKATAVPTSKPKTERQHGHLNKAAVADHWADAEDKYHVGTSELEPQPRETSRVSRQSEDQHHIGSRPKVVERRRTTRREHEPHDQGYQDNTPYLDTDRRRPRRRESKTHETTHHERVPADRTSTRRSKDSEEDIKRARSPRLVDDIEMEPIEDYDETRERRTLHHSSRRHRVSRPHQSDHRKTNMDEDDGVHELERKLTRTTLEDSDTEDGGVQITRSSTAASTDAQYRDQRREESKSADSAARAAKGENNDSGRRKHDKPRRKHGRKKEDEQASFLLQKLEDRDRYMGY